MKITKKRVDYLIRHWRWSFLHSSPKMPFSKRFCTKNLNQIKNLKQHEITN